jgi:hypothetical protein
LSTAYLRNQGKRLDRALAARFISVGARSGEPETRWRAAVRRSRRRGEVESLAGFFLAGYDRGVVQFVMDSLSTTTLSD